jgi:hypothetical protein
MKQYKQLVSGAERFCGGACLLSYIKDLSQAPCNDICVDHKKPKLSDDFSFWDVELDHWFRSSYESTVAQFFIQHNVPWKYESHTLLVDSFEYTPDFLIEVCNLFIEVKGLWGISAKKKFQKTLKAGVNLILIPDYLVRLLRREL